jgi:peptidoglycan/xylan/chitin deacetylase (PgdA/CDA1 family)
MAEAGEDGGGERRRAAIIAPVQRGAPLLAAAGAAWALPALAPVVPGVAGALRIATTIPARGAVALTFDDGPHPRGTPAILEILAAHGVTATFFMVGEQVNRSPRLAAEVAAAGHGIAVHGHRHRNLLRVPPRALRDDLDRAYTAIADATDTRPTLHRPPYGIYSWPALRAIRQRGWTPLLWSRWGRDWRRFITPAQIAANVSADLSPGDVLLLHDADDYSAPRSHERTAQALPYVLEAIEAAGLTTTQPGR